MVRRLGALIGLLLASRAGADGRIEAIELRVRLRDATAAARTPAQLAAPRRQALDALIDRSWTEERWILAGGSAVIVFEGGGHPLPGFSRVLLHESGDRADLLRPGTRYVTLPPRALGDLLEGGRTRRESYVVKTPTVEMSEGTSRWARSLRYQARTDTWRRRVRTTLTVWHRPASEQEALLGRMVVDLIALPFLDRSARRLLRRESVEVGFPTRWRIEVEDESQGGRAATPVLEGEVLSSKIKRIAGTTLRTPGPPRYEPIAHDAGGQLGARTLLSKLRGTDEAPGALRVDNRTPFHIYVLADGALLGRVGPKSEIRMDGLASGYYRLYARSRYGTFAWGPRDQYVPGSMTVDLP